MNELTSVIPRISPNALGWFIIGSSVYGTTTLKSDVDVVMVTDDDVDEHYASGKYDIQAMSESTFRNGLSGSHVLCLEFASYRFHDNLTDFYWFHDVLGYPSIDKTEVRKTISAIASNSYSKARKKLYIENENYLSMKSIFHAMRMVHYGIQIGEHGYIKDFTSDFVVNEWSKLRTIYSTEDDECILDLLDTEYKKKMNELRTEFRKYFPKG